MSTPSSLLSQFQKDAKILNQEDAQFLTKLWSQRTHYDTAHALSDKDTILELTPLIIAARKLSSSQNTSLAFTDTISDTERPHTTFFIASHNTPHTVNTVKTWLQYLGFITFDSHTASLSLSFNKNQYLSSASSQDDDPILFFSIKIEGQLSQKQKQNIQDHTLSSLEHLSQVNKDEDTMQATLRKITKELQNNPEPEHQEVALFLQWLSKGNFKLLGTRHIIVSHKNNTYTPQTPSSQKGLFHRSRYQAFHGFFSKNTPQNDIKNLIEKTQLLQISKANKRSPVIRATHADVISITLKINNEHHIHHFAGLFSHSSYISSVFDIPYIRQICNTVRDAVCKGRHETYKTTITDLINTYPRDEIYQSKNDELHDAITCSARAANLYESDIYVRQDPLSRYASIIVHFPRNLYRKELALLLGKWLEKRYHSIFQIHYDSMPDKSMWHTQIILRHTSESNLNINEDSLRKELPHIILSWHGKLVQTLFRQRIPFNTHPSPSHAAWLNLKNTQFFSAEYQQHYSVEDAKNDTVKLISLRNNTIDLNLFQIPEEQNSDTAVFHLKIYTQGTGVPLYKMVPVLRNMDLNIISEIPYAVSLDGHNTTHTIHDFLFHQPLSKDKSSSSFDDIRHHFEESCLAALNNTIPDDVFNRLIMTAGLSARSVDILRAYSWYMKYINFSYSASTVVNALARYPAITQNLISFFFTRFDPSSKLSLKKRRDATDTIVHDINNLLVNVSNLSDDTIFRAFANLITSTLRTNFFQKKHNHIGGIIALKFDSRSITDMPDPRPLREIFVHARDFSACHLRFGLVARGGLRFSDRSDDLRTEILGLAKAQQVKNAVIIPLGAKGGFVLKNPPSDRKSFLDEGLRCYKLFISTMLDITDNRVGDTISSPSNLVAYDDKDPYLVVAADKGTATFSDFANKIAEQHKFWLGDGFASGGSQGYDHKKMGITARGAWESVKRHFRDMGINTQDTPFNVIGVGDMSGDVFGNGMLLSPCIKLNAAFNHMHIFIDPNPNPDTSFAERQRLFNTPGTTWADYNSSVLSKGATIFSRSQKSLSLTPEIMEWLGTSQKTLAPHQLLSLILKTKTDLLWFGGIGTYIKASSESHSDASDHVNDTIRVNACDIKARVIGEGANLGVTQKARIEFALHGGKCNTDAIDNSAGVNSSDYEVNIKILLNKLVAEKQLSMPKRNQILRSMTNTIATLVLNNNQRQNDALAVTLQNNLEKLDRHVQLMRSLEAEQFLDRNIEDLPSPQDLEQRVTSGNGLTCPELSVLLAYDKNYTYKELLKTNLPDDPCLAHLISNYFPDRLNRDFKDAVGNHPLKREITATLIANLIIDHTGPGFIYEMQQNTGRSLECVVRAYIIISEIINITPIRDQLESIRTQISATAFTRAHLETIRTAERCTRWILAQEPNLIPIQNLREQYAPTADTLKKQFPHKLPLETQQLLLQRVDAFKNSGINQNLSLTLGSLKNLSTLFDIALISNQYDISTPKIIQTFFLVAELLSLDILRTQANTINPRDAWQQNAITISIDDLWKVQRIITEKLIATNVSGKQAIDFLHKNYSQKLNAALEQKNNILAQNSVNVSSLNVFLRSLEYLHNDITPLTFAS